MKREYAKVFLYAYPWLGALSEAMGQSAENKALLSYRGEKSVEEAALGVVAEYAMQSAVEELLAGMRSIVRGLDDEEKFLLEYKYFRRQGKLAARRGLALPYCARTYFRKQSALLGKIVRELCKRGWSDRRFLSEFGQFPPFLKILRALREGRERAVWEKRKRGGALQNSARPGSYEGARFPCATNTATATAATHATQIPAMAPAESPSAPPATAAGTLAR